MPDERTDRKGSENGAAPDAVIGVDSERFNRNMLIFLIVCEIFLVIIDVTINYCNWTDVGAARRFANIAREEGVGTWFMSTQTLLTGLLLFTVYLISKNTGERKIVFRNWQILAVFFTIMAADDAVQFHERAGSTFKALVEAPEGAPATGLGRVLKYFQAIPGR